MIQMIQNFFNMANIKKLCLIRSGFSYDNRDTKENYFMTLESRWGACLALHNTQTYEPLIRHGGYCQNFKSFADVNVRNVQERTRTWSVNYRRGSHKM